MWSNLTDWIMKIDSQLMIFSLFFSAVNDGIDDHGQGRWALSPKTSWDRGLELRSEQREDLELWQLWSDFPKHIILYCWRCFFFELSSHQVIKSSSHHIPLYSIKNLPLRPSETKHKTTNQLGYDQCSDYESNLEMEQMGQVGATSCCPWPKASGGRHHHTTKGGEHDRKTMENHDHFTISLSQKLRETEKFLIFGLCHDYSNQIQARNCVLVR